MGFRAVLNLGVLAVTAAIVGQTDCITIAGTAVGTATIGSTTATALTFPAGTLVALNVLAGGAAILKTAAVLYGLGSVRGGRGGRRRGRRSPGDDSNDLDAEFALLASIEPDQCYRRLICDLATGQMPKSENDIIVSLFEGVEIADVLSPAFEFSVAAEIGKLVKDVDTCELRYRCPVSGSQLLEATAK